MRNLTNEIDRHQLNIEVDKCLDKLLKIIQSPNNANEMYKIKNIISRLEELKTTLESDFLDDIIYLIKIMIKFNGENAK